MTRLYLGKVGVVLGGLQRMQAQSDEAAKAMANCGDYLNEHRGRTTYQKLRRGGYPLGSGGIESSNKFIGHVRLKRSGAWWYAVNSNQMLALRCAKYNGTLDQAYGSPIFKAVRKKRCKASYTPLRRSPKSPECAVGEGSGSANVDTSAVAPP